MSAFFSRLFLFASVFASVASGQGRPTNAPIYITHVTVIDTESGKESPDRTVVISGDRISEVKASKGVKTPSGSKVVDGTGKYLIPGLWDMHVHVWDYDSTFPLFLANGVTGVREMFGPTDANKFRAELAEKKILAPHFYLASPIIDGHPKGWPTSIEVNTPEEARKVVDEQKQKGADFIKVYSRLSRESYFAIVEESRRQKIPFEGHVPTLISAWEASNARQKSFEHLNGIPLACSSREEELQAKMAAAMTMKERFQVVVEGSRSHSEEKCQRLFAEFKKNGTWQVPTLTVNRSFAMLNNEQFRKDERLRYFGGDYRNGLVAKDDFRLKAWTAEDFAVQHEIFAYNQRVVGAMFRAGVPMLAGTDARNPFCFPGFSLHDELALMVESGVSPLGALRAATRNPAIFMDATDKYGSVTPGKLADLVLLDANPLKDIHNTTKISEVFLAGKEFDRAALDQMLKEAERAAAKLPTSPPSNPASVSAEAVYSQFPEANKLFLDAREYFKKGNPALGGALSDVRKSIELFEAAIAKDPHFALAYAELSTAWASLGWSAPGGLQNIDLLPHVKSAALKAADLDDRLPAAHLALASFYLNFEFDWPRAEGEFKRAIELAPNDARSHSAYALYLSKMGRFSDALTHAQRASELSQTSATDRMFMFIYFAMRRFDLAEQYGLSASLKDDHFLNHMFLGFTYLQEHKYSQGISELEKLRAGGTGGGLGGLAYAYAVGGRTADARLLLKQLTANEQGRPVIVRYRLAAVYLALGDKDKAIELLRKDYEVRDNWMNWLKVDPVMDPLRSDPRFQDLMRLMNFASDIGQSRVQ